jgi:hypothetical protein
MYKDVFQSAKTHALPQKIFVDFGSNGAPMFPVVILIISRSFMILTRRLFPLVGYTQVGSDLRQVIHDGWKREDALAIDVRPG